MAVIASRALEQIAVGRRKFARAFLATGACRDDFDFKYGAGSGRLREHDFHGEAQGVGIDAREGADPQDNTVYVRRAGLPGLRGEATTRSFTPPVTPQQKKLTRCLKPVPGLWSV